MSVALQLYQQLRDAPNDDSRAKIIAEAFEQLEDRYPNLKDVATQGNLRETELRLQKEIKEIEANLRKEIKEIDLRIKDVEIRTIQAIHRHTFWVIGSVSTIIGFIRLLDWFLTRLHS